MVMQLGIIPEFWGHDPKFHQKHSAEKPQMFTLFGREVEETMRLKEQEYLILTSKPKWISTWFFFDCSTKPIFDHLRNLGICILVFAAGSLIVLNEFTPLAFGDTNRFFVGSMLMLLGIALFVKNAANLLFESWTQVSSNRKETGYFLVNNLALDFFMRLTEATFICTVYLIIIYPFLTARIEAMLIDSPQYLEWLQALEAFEELIKKIDTILGVNDIK